MKTFLLFSSFLLALSLAPPNLVACSGDECVTVTGKKEAGEPGAGIAHGPGDAFPQLPKPVGSFSEPGGGQTPKKELFDERYANEKGKEKAKEIKDKKEKEGSANPASIFDSLLLPQIAATRDAIAKLIDLMSIAGGRSETEIIVRRDKETGVIIEETHKETCWRVGINDKYPCTRIKMRHVVDFVDHKDKLHVMIEDVRPIEGSSAMEVVDFFWFAAKNGQDVENFFKSIEE